MAVSATPLPGLSPQHVFDYVIVGSGPGGLTVANRLTENPNVTVAVIEAGTWAEDMVGNLSAVPGYGGSFLLKSVDSTPTAVDWGFVTTQQRALNDIVVRYPRGKTLGGSSNLNAMAWGESSRGAFAKWASEVDDPSFTYDNIAPYYKKPVRFTPARAGTRYVNATPAYDPAEVGHAGALDVTYPPYTYAWTTWLAVMLEAAGMQAENTFIDGNLNGSAWHMSATNQSTGMRSSAATAYLRPVLGRRNLVIFHETLAERILFRDGNVASGVLVSSSSKWDSRSGNSTFTLQARREVIVAGGVFQSPQLLQVSGVGPRQLLEELGIPLVADRPGVGQNMQDQIFANIVHRVNLPTGDTLGITEADIVAFNANATGPLTNPGGEYGGFEAIPDDLRVRMSEQTLQALASYPEDWPDIQYLTLPRFLGDLGTTTPPDDGSNYASLMGIIMKPNSTGSVSISSDSMRDPPLINPNWMTTDSDLQVMVAIFKRMRQLWSSPEMHKIVIGDEVWPGANVESDEEIVAFLRETVTPMSHAVATCRMGKIDDPDAVVDSKGRVIGVQRLRVIDGSAMPFLPAGGEPQSVVYMLAEKQADVIKAEW
ncbi:hypothetical protein BDW72DRAFT_199442 [Aspergillus terricola var. indicus]